MVLSVTDGIGESTNWRKIAGLSRGSQVRGCFFEGCQQPGIYF